MYQVIKNIIIIAFFTATVRCSQLQTTPKGNQIDQQLIQLALLTGSPQTAGCSVTTAPPIPNALAYVKNKRTKFDISSCAVEDLSKLNLVANSSKLNSGISGQSAASSFATSGAYSRPISEGGTNVEVTFSIKAGGSLEIYTYGLGSDSILSGPSFRVSDSKKEEFYSSMLGGFTTTSKGTAPLSPQVNYTYCIDFQYAQSQQWINAWPKACSEVGLSEKSSMMMFPVMQMMNIPTFSDSKVGFVLNGATVTSFTIGGIVSQID
ncbi:hypothetical protein [Leptospira adleri]|uniref:Uncharacterized protein n=1 Tax=Leptospira adleri TaxID=2023186 RepID=A0A2M9YKK1_9LEPT|nr:hypothetical protein [Leptospira adleri]PJZ52068.1 hypothetical protein CH380_16640 [Leptospira adleri]PJZ62930.1 hypothetical protein CH376_05420 [Leptospira adleri]